jgi:hypothetical protein
MEAISRTTAPVVGLLLAFTVLAQPPGPPPGMGPPPLLTLVAQRAVQSELKLDAAQLKKLSDANARQIIEMQRAGQQPEQRMKKMQELMESGNRAVEEVLKPEQRQRLREISWQLQGPLALTDPEVAKELGLSEEQQIQIAAVKETVHAQMIPPMGKGGPPPNPDTMRKKLAEVNKTAEGKIQQILTPEQQTRWKTLLGKTIAGNITLGPPPGFPPPPPR